MWFVETHSHLIKINKNQALTKKGKKYHFCSVLAISNIGAKHDFKIWVFKGFFGFGHEKQILE